MIFPRLLSLALVLAPLSASCSEDAEPLPSTCNGREELCDRRFDEVAFAATHNSMADTDHDIVAANQTHDIAKQLEDGVRGLMLDLYSKTDGDGNPFVQTCHGICLRQNYSFVDVLGVIRAHLRSNRDSIVTLILENYVSADEIADAVRAAKVERYLTTHALGTPWPTLREMIADDTRLVILTDAAGGTETSPYPWLMDQWQYAFQNPYAATEESEFSCDVDRGSDAPNSLFVMNHFLTQGLGSLEFAQEVNPYASLEPHVSRCKAERGRIPNFVTVDFYEVGDLFRVVDELNGFTAP